MSDNPERPVINKALGSPAALSRCVRWLVALTYRDEHIPLAHPKVHLVTFGSEEQARDFLASVRWLDKAAIYRVVIPINDLT